MSVNTANRHILIDFLLFAVPLQIIRIKTGDESLKYPRIDLTTIIGEKGDVLLYGGSGAGEVAAAVVEAIATLAFSPGGITIFGLHFEETRNTEANDV